MFDAAFRNINKLFFLHSKMVTSILQEMLFNKYYMPLIEIKDFNALIDNKASIYQPVKKKGETYEKLVEMSWNDNYITGNL